MHSLARAALRTSSGPTWLVSNGELTVGPVDTDLLIRGVISGKIPDTCQVSVSGGPWRSIRDVREVRAATRGQYGPIEPISAAVRQAMRWLADAQDIGGAHSRALHGACAITGAEVGLAYRIRAPLEMPVVSACCGDPPLELGAVIPSSDPALILLEDGEPQVLLPGASAAARAIATRLSPVVPLAGLALVPIRTALDVTAVLELGRFDHPFRMSDTRAIIPLLVATVARIEELSWEPLGARGRSVTHRSSLDVPYD